MKTLLFNPFQKYSDIRLLAAGLLTAVAGIFGAFVTNTHFDGILDTHFSENVTLQTAVLESVFNTLSILLVFFPLGKLINRKTRIIDILNIALIVKIPAYWLLLFNVNQWGYHHSQDILYATSEINESVFSTDTIVFILLISIFTIISFIWLIILLYNGFKVAAHTKNTVKHITVFIVGVVLAEIVSKILIYNCT